MTWPNRHTSKLIAERYRQRMKCSCGRTLRVKPAGASPYCPMWKQAYALERRGMHWVSFASSILVRALDSAGVVTALDPQDARHTVRGGRWVPKWAVPPNDLPMLTPYRGNPTVISIPLLARVFRDAFEEPSIRYRVFDVIRGAVVVYRQAAQQEE